jgi:hypothetical protein
MQLAATQQLTGAIIAGAENLETVTHAAKSVLSAEAFLQRLEFPGIELRYFSAGSTYHMVMMPAF